MPHATKLTLIATLLASSLLIVSAARGVAAAQLPSMTVIATDEQLGIRLHAVPIGYSLSMEALLSFEDIVFYDGSSALPVVQYDVYVGVMLPDGRFASWTGDPHAATLVTGTAPVPILAGILPTTAPQFFRRYQGFTAADPQGWHVLYGLAVRAGANPLDPREWAGWNAAVFFPILILPQTQQESAERWRE
ncbi:MAG TPA: hypothetical protein VK548_10790 [Candidatus Acidoferrum sp.]|nr:hypothetical protein [Candidatus Acidoferrum sp.]